MSNNFLLLTTHTEKLERNFDRHLCFWSMCTFTYFIQCYPSHFSFQVLKGKYSSIWSSHQPWETDSAESEWSKVTLWASGPNGYMTLGLPHSSWKQQVLYCTVSILAQQGKRKWPPNAYRSVLLASQNAQCQHVLSQEKHFIIILPFSVPACRLLPPFLLLVWVPPHMLYCQR